MTDRERLIKLLDDVIYNSLPKHNKGEKVVENIADYLLSNSVIVLPCRVGDTVFRIKALSRQEMYRRGLKPTEEIKRHKGQPLRFYNYVIYEIEKTTMKKSWYKDLGKTVFLTREEAEKSLKECEQNGG